MNNTKMNVKYVVSPLSGRPVRVGGRVYNALIREGVLNKTLQIDNQPKQRGKNIIATANDRTSAYRLKSQLEKEKPLQDKIYSVGNDKKSIVVKNKKAPSLKPNNIIPLMSKASIEVNKKLLQDKDFMNRLSQINNPDELDSNMREHIESLLLQELVNRENKEIPVKKFTTNNFNSTNNKDEKNSKKFVVKKPQILQSKGPSSTATGSNRRRIISDTEYDDTAFETSDQEDDDEGYTTYE